MTDDLSTFTYVMDLAADMEGLSSHTITKYVTSSYISLKNPYPLTAYAEKPQSTRAAADQMRRYVRGGTYWIL